MTEKGHKAFSRLIMYDKIKHYYEVEHKSIRWIARKTNLNFRTIKKYLEVDQKEFEDFSDHVINRPHMLEPYKGFITICRCKPNSWQSARSVDLLILIL